MPRAPRFHTREQPLMELFNRVGTGCPSMPDDETFHLELVGLLVKAQEESPIPIHSGAFGARDWSLLASPQDVGRQAEFLRHFTRGLSLLIQSYKNWDGPIFPRRYRAMEISDEEEAQVACLAELTLRELSHRDTSRHAAPFARALASGKTVRGLWVDQAAYSQALGRGESVRRMDFAEEVELTLEPLPCRQHLSEAERAHANADLVDEVGRSQEQAGTPRRPQRRGWAFAVDEAAFETMRELRERFLKAFRSAASLLRKGIRDAAFPANCFPPAFGFVGYG